MSDLAANLATLDALLDKHRASGITNLINGEPIIHLAARLNFWRCFKPNKSDTPARIP